MLQRYWSKLVFWDLLSLAKKIKTARSMKFNNKFARPMHAFLRTILSPFQDFGNDCNKDPGGYWEYHCKDYKILEIPWGYFTINILRRVARILHARIHKDLCRLLLGYECNVLPMVRMLFNSRPSVYKVLRGHCCFEKLFWWHEERTRWKNQRS